jgi:hypothetical protein
MERRQRCMCECRGRVVRYRRRQAGAQQQTKNEHHCECACAFVGIRALGHSPDSERTDPGGWTPRLGERPCRGWRVRIGPGQLRFSFSSGRSATQRRRRRGPIVGPCPVGKDPFHRGAKSTLPLNILYYYYHFHTTHMLVDR